MAKSKNESANQTPATEKKRRSKKTIKFRLEFEQDDNWFTVGTEEFPLIETDSLEDAKMVKSLLVVHAPHLYPKATKFRVAKIESKSPEAIGL